MKKPLIIVLIILLLGIIAIIVPIVLRYDVVQYDKDMQVHAMSLAHGDLVARYQDVQTLVAAGNSGRIVSALSPVARQRLYKEPPVRHDEVIQLTFPSGAHFDVYPSPEDEQLTLVHYRYRSKTRWLSIQKLDTWNWIHQASSPQGLAEPNQLVQTP